MRRRVILSAIVLSLLAATVCCVSMYVVWLGDDVDYGYFIRDSIWNSSGEITSVSDFFASQVNHYCSVNGRFMAHALVQLFCAVLGQPAFAVCNALVYVAFVLLLARAGGVRGAMRWPSALLGLSALVLLVFVTKMMPTTQIGFVWMFALSLVWLGLFIRPFKIAGRWRVPVMTALCLFSMVAGNGQEALSIGLTGATGLWWLSRRCRVGVWRTVLLAGYWLGTMAICLSPGTLGRASATHIPLDYSLMYTLLSLRAFWLLVVVCAVQLVRHRLSWRGVWRIGRLYVCAMAILFVFNFAVGVYSNRQLFGIELLSLIMTLRLLHGHRISWPWAAVATLAAVALVAAQMQAVAVVRRQYEYIADTARRQGGGTVYFDRTLGSTGMLLRNFRYYEEIVGQSDADTHHSLQKHLRGVLPKVMRVNKPDTAQAEYERVKTVYVWPEYINGLKFVADTVIEYAPHHYLVCVTESRHARIVADSHVLPWTCHTDTVTLGRSAVHGKGWEAYIVLSPPRFGVLDTVRLVY